MDTYELTGMNTQSCLLMELIGMNTVLFVTFEFLNWFTVFAYHLKCAYFFAFIMVCTLLISSYFIKQIKTNCSKYSGRPYKS